MKYSVTIPYPCWVTVKVEADSKEEAEEMAWDEAGITSFCGNGGTDKLIGIIGSNISIEAGDIPLECDGFSIEVYKEEDDEHSGKD